MMDAVVEAAQTRRRPRDVAIFLILRNRGMRRESVATLRVHHLDGPWGLRGVKVKGGKTRDIPLPAAVMTFLQRYVERVLSRVEAVGPETPLFLVNVGPARGRQDACADDRKKQRATLQGVRPYHRLPRAEAARSAPRRRARGPRAASRP